MSKYPYAAVLSACLAASAFAATPPGTLVVAKNIEDIVGLDPAEAFEFSSAEVVANIYQNLVKSDIRNPNQVVPALAQSWTAGSDGKSLQFRLKPGARFASGNPVRAEDVLFSFRRVIQLNKAPAFILQQMGWTNENFAAMVSKNADGSVTVRWNGDFGVPFVLNLLAAKPGAIVDEKLVMANQKGSDLGNSWLNSHSAGSGPFKLRLYKPKEVLMMDANPASPAGAPTIKAVMLKNVVEPATQRLLLESGDADIARDLGPDQISAISGKPGIRVENYPQSAIHFISLNQKHESLRNPALWEAMRYLVDYQGISGQLLKGQMRIHQAFLPDGFPGALTEKPYEYNPAKAKAILAKAGISSPSFDLDVINAPRFMDMAQSLQASMAKGGIKVNLLPATGSQVITRYRARQHQAMLLYWGPDYFDPHANAKAFAYNVDNSDGNYQSTTTWRNAWAVPELSSKTLAALGEKDAAKRARLYQALQREVQAKSPIIVMLQEQNQVALRSNVKGYVNGLTQDLIQYSKVEK